MLHRRGLAADDFPGPLRLRALTGCTAEGEQLLIEAASAGRLPGQLGGAGRAGEAVEPLRRAGERGLVGRQGFARRSRRRLVAARPLRLRLVARDPVRTAAALGRRQRGGRDRDRLRARATELHVSAREGVVNMRAISEAADVMLAEAQRMEAAQTRFSARKGPRQTQRASR